MKKVLVMGINGTFGGQVAKALLQSGYEVSAFLRDPKKLPAEFSQIKALKGDVKDIELVRKACKGVDVVVYGVNPPNYDWRNKVVPYLDNVVKVAEEQKLAIVFPGNVYVFDPTDGPEFDENASQNPLTEKGQLRKTMESRLQQAAENGAKVVILRMGDYISPNAKSAWLSQLVKPNKKSYTLSSPGPKDLLHTWAYVPDAANVVSQLIAKLDELPDFSLFHFKGFRVSMNDIAHVIQSVTGKPVKVKNFPWWFIKLSAPFSTMFRGLLEMRYLWDKKINLSDHKLRALLGESYPSTNLETALVESRIVEPQGEKKPGYSAVKHA